MSSRGSLAVVVDEAEAGGLGVVDELGDDGGGQAGQFGRSWAVARSTYSSASFRTLPAPWVSSTGTRASRGVAGRVRLAVANQGPAAGFQPTAQVPASGASSAGSPRSRRATGPCTAPWRARLGLPGAVPRRLLGPAGPSASPARRSSETESPGSISTTAIRAASSVSGSFTRLANQAQDSERLGRRRRARPADGRGPAAPARRRRGPASSSWARQTAGSSGRSAGSRRSNATASSNWPVRIARLARPSQTRSSSGSAFSRALRFVSSGNGDVSRR